MRKEEAIDREDSIWLTLEDSDNPITKIIDWLEINEINGDFKNATEIIVVGIPLYGRNSRTGEDILSLATQYVYNQVEIFKRTKQNKELYSGIGSEK